MYRGRILVVDDEDLIRWSLREALTQAGHTVYDANCGEAAKKIGASVDLDLALVDLKLGDTDGITLMKELLREQEGLTVIIMTAFSSVETAVEAMKLGAFDYVSKPFNLEEVILTVNRAIESSSLKREVKTIHTDMKSRYGIQNIIGKSAPTQEVIKLIRKVAQSEANTILLRGDSGVGKDLVARAIHFESRRANQPFLTITCTTLQETLLESELFGHEKGSFTDAKSQKRGLLEMANGGTAFLDEIGDMAPALQAKLLHFLEHKTFRRVGGTEDIRVDVRVIAATNRDLELAIREGKFREDLYYRLNIIPIQLPALRERSEDVPMLVNHFVQLFNREFKKSVVRVSKEAMEILTHYSWPGNIRELRNVIERAMLLVSGPEILPEDLMIQRAKPTSADKFAVKLPPEGVNIDDVERSLVVQALERTGWNRAAAARLLGCSRDQIRYRIEKFGLQQSPAAAE
jgi:DNA-binding NtrC family response regulator